MSNVKHMMHVSPFGKNMYMYTDFDQVCHAVQDTYSSSTSIQLCIYNIYCMRVLHETRSRSLRNNCVKMASEGDPAASSSKCSG